MPAFTRRRAAYCLVAAVALGGCTTIERPIGPPVGPVGPQIVINKPGKDTVITSGQAVNFLVTVTSSSGIDSVYTEVVGSSLNSPALVNLQSPATFGLSVPPDRQSGGTLILVVHGNDTLGQVGDTAVRVVQLQ